MALQTMKLTDGRELPVTEIVKAVDAYGTGLSASSIKFIASLIDDPPIKYTPKQIKWLNDLYNENV